MLYIKMLSRSRVQNLYFFKALKSNACLSFFRGGEEMKEKIAGDWVQIKKRYFVTTYGYVHS